MPQERTLEVTIIESSALWARVQVTCPSLRPRIDTIAFSEMTFGISKVFAWPIVRPLKSY